MKNFKMIWEIYNDSFPDDEIRNLAQQIKLMDNPLYHLEPYYADKTLAGFIASWKFSSFTFIEHLAIDSQLRGRGLGSLLMIDFINKNKYPIILEVEPPQSPLQKRRIEFYKNLGFHVNPYDYHQPPLSADKNSVHLLLMTYPEPVNKSSFYKYKKILYKEVYRVEPHKKRANI